MAVQFPREPYKLIWTQCGLRSKIPITKPTLLFIILRSDKYSPPELMKEALVCVFLTRCLQATGYFGFQEKIEPIFGPEELQIAMWMHRFMRIARFNCHAIREVKRPFEKVKSKGLFCTLCNTLFAHKGIS